jgi:uncharacterized protein
MNIITKKLLKIIVLIGFVLVLVLTVLLPSIAASAMLHPFRRQTYTATPTNCKEVTLEGQGIKLKGWSCEASGERKGTLIYLHGIADNRSSGSGVIERFCKRGFDVIAYDSRAHGQSGGDVCTYGFFEREDLRKILDTLEPGPVILIGSSLGAAVAIQTAAIDKRISAVVSAEVFSDLRTVATDRTPFFFTAAMRDRAFSVAEQKGGFRIDDTNQLLATKTITIPVLVIHGDADIDTKPDHSHRVFNALSEPKRLILVAGAGHNHSLSGNVWGDIEQWIDSILASTPTSLSK